MAEHNELGRLGEAMAVEYLQKNGYEILATNWVYQKAEIDIIARKNSILAIVEVKTRSSEDFGLPQDFVNRKKIRLLLKAVDEYTARHEINDNVRFDIIAVSKSAQGFSIEHLEDAFYYF